MPDGNTASSARPANEAPESRVYARSYGGIRVDIDQGLGTDAQVLWRILDESDDDYDEMQSCFEFRYRKSKPASAFSMFDEGSPSV